MKYEGDGSKFFLATSKSKFAIIYSIYQAPDDGWRSHLKMQYIIT